MKLFEKWFKKRINKENVYYSRVVSLFFYKQHFKNIGIFNNGAIKGVDRCFDFSIWFLGFNFNYTDFDYDK